MPLTKVGGLPAFQFQHLSAESRLIHAVFTRQGGESSPPYHTLNVSTRVGDDPETVATNRFRLCQALGEPSNALVGAFLVHGTTPYLVRNRASLPEALPKADALLADQPGCLLLITYGDCVSILLYDPAHHAIGLAHAGWRGTILGMATEAVRAMTEAFGSQPQRLLAGLGPAIGPCCYAIREDVAQAVRAKLPDAESLLMPNSDGQLHLDLWQANRRQLLTAGLRQEQIEGSGLCTACNTDLFFSHRGDRGHTGRFGVVMGLRP
ncbi:MAG: peptidoglycan editing factor PgeF [Chloroflexi bacterium]|nr:peptidoglycan editing factor PgeF [Chloroflexota bacterium]